MGYEHDFYNLKRNDRNLPDKKKMVTNKTLFILNSNQIKTWIFQNQTFVQIRNNFQKNSIVQSHA